MLKPTDPLSRPEALAQHRELLVIAMLQAKPIEAIRYLVGGPDGIVIITGYDPETEAAGGILCSSIFVPALGPGQKFHG